MDDILSRIASFARNVPPVQTASSAAKCPTRTDLIEAIVSPRISPDRLKERVNVHNTKAALLCFSKDRPYQLEQFLISAKLFLSPDESALKIFVLYSPGNYWSNYQGVFARHPNAVPVRETDDEGFAAALLHCMEFLLDVVGNNGAICFCVDDLIFIDNINLSYLAGVLASESGSKLLGFHLKLHPGVTYSHAASQICYPPILEGFHYDCEGSTRVTHLEYEHAGCTGDWKYALDLCAGLYRLCDVRHLLTAIVASHGLHGIRNPNVLEVSLNKSFWEHQNKDHKDPVTPSNAPPQDTGAACKGPDLPPTQLHQYTRSACLTAPCVKVVTINIVQSTYEVPTFSTPGGDIQALNNLCGGVEVKRNTHVLDFSKYASETSLSAHVGSLHLVPSREEDTQPPASADAAEGASEEAGAGAVASVYHGQLDAGITSNSEVHVPSSVCVLIPVRDGQKRLSQCLRSLLTQPQGCPFKILLIDDGSSDDTMNIALAIQKEVQLGVFLSSNPGANMEVVDVGRIGLAAALDRGIARAGTDYIARLDCDDICEAGRLKRQRDYLDRHQHIHVVGGQAIVIGESSPTECPTHNSSSSSSSNSNSSSSSSSSSMCECALGVVAGNYPTLPGLVHWGMLSRCCIIHPSVMFRTHIVMQCGSYSCIRNTAGLSSTAEDPDQRKAVEFTEDYALWLRILKSYPFSICNLPHVVIRLRKHGDSKSASQAAALTEASAMVRWRLVCHTLRVDEDIHASMRVGTDNFPYVPCKHHWDCVVHPNQYVRTEGDAEGALTLFGRLYYAYLNQLVMRTRSLGSFAYTDSIDESRGFDSEDQQGNMVMQLLKEAMLINGKRLYQAGRLYAATTRPLKQGSPSSEVVKEGSGVKEGAGSDKQSIAVKVQPRWEQSFREDDRSSIKALAGADIIRCLSDLNI